MASQTSVIPDETSTPSSYVSPTAKPTLISTETLTALPTNSSTLTPLPVLSLNDAKALILSLAEDNGGCQLPCLWGFTPGKTDVEDLRNTLSQFGHIDSPQDFYADFSWHGDVGGLSFGFWENGAEVIGEFGHTGATAIDNLTLHVAGPRLEVANTTSPLLERFRNYLLPQILSKYGEPSKVIIGPHPFDPDRPNDWLPMNLGLFYQDQGFYIEYILTKQAKGNYFVSCPSKVVEVSIVVWNPSESRTLLDIAKLNPSFWGINENNLDEYYRSVDEALSITPKEFYEKYKDDTNNECISAPMSLWPYQ